MSNYCDMTEMSRILKELYATLLNPWIMKDNILIYDSTHLFNVNEKIIKKILEIHG